MGLSATRVLSDSAVASVGAEPTADIAERAMQVAPGPGIQVRGIQDEETISRGRRPAATERIYEIFMRGEPGKVHGTRLNCECWVA